MECQQQYEHQYHQEFIPPPSPPSSSITDDEKLNVVSPLLDDNTTGRLQTCFGNIDQAQHQLKSQQRAVYLRSASEPSPPSFTLQQQHPKTLIDIHRLAIEALQNLYAEERRRNEYLEEQAQKANEEITKLQQEVSHYKRARNQEQRKWQQVYGLVDTVRDVSTSPQQQKQKSSSKPTSPEDLSVHLRHILTNITTLHHHAPSTGSLVTDFPEHDPYYY
ncbi:hypothetical protein INT45_003971 [Circinella minor]|uniref:Uncharacterized protein n=1 Tax=Circinella minor TaxID=1195481 RepID=A0A8H7RX85_9FUNG|nr:hypothetical protein INT45_003971 [Circinella minor]